MITTSVYADDPTSLVPNHLLYSNGAILQDNFPEILPGGIEFSDDYTTYTNWLLSLGVPAGIVGTMNIIGEYNLVVGKWKGTAFDPSRPEIVSTLGGMYPEDIVFGTSGIDRNVWSEMRIMESDQGGVLFLNTESSRSFIRNYADLDYVIPVNPEGLGINIESNVPVMFMGGAVPNNSGMYGQDIKMIVKDKKVGVSHSSFTGDPQYTLDIQGKLRFSGLFSGKLGDFVEKQLVGNVILDSSHPQETEVLTLEDVTIPDGWTVIAVASLSAAWASHGYTAGHNDADAGTRIFIYNANSRLPADERHRSLIMAFDYENLNGYSPYGSFSNVTLYKNTSGGDLVVDVAIFVTRNPISGQFLISDKGAGISCFLFPSL